MSSVGTHGHSRSNGGGGDGLQCEGRGAVVSRTGCVAEVAPGGGVHGRNVVRHRRCVIIIISIAASVCRCGWCQGSSKLHSKVGIGAIVVPLGLRGYGLYDLFTVGRANLNLLAGCHVWRNVDSHNSRAGVSRGGWCSRRCRPCTADFYSFQAHAVHLRSYIVVRILRRTLLRRSLLRRRGGRSGKQHTRGYHGSTTLAIRFCPQIGKRAHRALPERTLVRFVIAVSDVEAGALLGSYERWIHRWT
mmetsp:Transcript_32583/g.62306  ORF Transcript_32583/g.62306 Transcript_32583/m.62306 type:complete len:246 (-) Transcript_32583:318-1055(-)